MNKGTGFFLVTVSLFALCGCASLVPPDTFSYSTAEFQSIENRPRVIAMTAPAARMFVMAMFSASQDMDVATELESAVGPYLIELLAQKGYEVKAPARAETMSDLELLTLTSLVDSSFDDLFPYIYDKPKRIKERAYSLGENGHLLASHLDVDSLLLVRLEGKAMTPDPFITSAGSLSLHVAVVDGGSGDVEAYYWVVIGATGLRKFKTSPRGVVQAAVSEFGKHFPVARGVDNMRTSADF